MNKIRGCTMFLTQSLKLFHIMTSYWGCAERLSFLIWCSMRVNFSSHPLPKSKIFNWFIVFSLFLAIACMTRTNSYVVLLYSADEALWEKLVDRTILYI